MVLFNILTKQLVQKFNVLEEKVQNGGGQWANVSMARFVQWPANFNTNYNYAVLFSDSCLLISVSCFLRIYHLNSRLAVNLSIT